MSFDEQDWNRPMMGSGARDTVLERRSTIENNDGVVNRLTYPILYTDAIYKGKFFTRGCRGMLESIQVYCDGDAVDTLTIRYSPHPCLGPVGEVSIIPADGYAWQDFPIEEMWNYDSLFIWVYECTANITWGYDAALPYDGHESGDAGATWSDLAIRPFIRAVYTGETPGDVPVSGTVNTIEVPSVGGIAESEAPVNCPNGVITDLVTMQGAGTMLMAHVTGHPAVNPSHWDRYYQMTVEADGRRAITLNHMEITQSPDSPTGRSSCGELVKYSVAGVDYMQMNIRLPIKFRRSLRLRFRQQTGAAMTCTGTLYANIQR